MRVIRHTDKFLLHLSNREKELLFNLLELYPQIPPGHFKLSKAGEVPEPEANQRLLDEALAEQRTASRKQLRALLEDPKRFEETPSGFRLRLSEGDVDWLLQVLNDIRIGSWVRLGSPERKVDWKSLKPEKVPLIVSMEMAGHIQMELVSALARAKA